jgi:hypothetical protein
MQQQTDRRIRKRSRPTNSPGHRSTSNELKDLQWLRSGIFRKQSSTKGWPFPATLPSKPSNSSSEHSITTTNPNSTTNNPTTTTNMQFIAISAIAMAAVAAAMPAGPVLNEKYQGEVVRISLPTGCTLKLLGSKLIPLSSPPSRELPSDPWYSLRGPLGRHRWLLRRRGC